MSEANERLVEAVRSGNFNAAERALNEGADPNCIYRDRELNSKTPVLFIACANRDARIVNLLLQRGANPNAYEEVITSGSWEDLSEDWAPYEGSESKGPRAGHYTPCIDAAVSDIEIMKALLEKGADPNACSLRWTSAPTEDRQSTLQSESITPEARKLLEFYGAKDRVSRKPHPRRVGFRPSEHAPFEQQGTAVVTGLAAAHTPDGETVVAAGETVRLVPATSYWAEWWRREIQGRRELMEPDPRAAKSERRATVDDQGKFRFDKLPEGSYYICCPMRLRWSRLELSSTVSVEDVHQSIYLGDQVTIRSGENIEVNLAPIRQNS